MTVNKAKTKAKSNYHSLKAGPLLDENTRMDYLFGKELFLDYPSKITFRERLIKQMYEWVNEERSFELQQFLTVNNIPRKTFYQWCEAHSDIREAWEDIKLMLASKRRLAATFNKQTVNDRMILRDLHRYDPEEREIDRYHSDMKVEEGNKSHTFNILLGKPEVKDKEQLKIEVDRTKE